MEINGVAHIFITSGDFERSVAFYRQLLPFLGLKPVGETADYFYCVGGRTGVAIRRSENPEGGGRFDQQRTGLHHICFRARERADIDEAHGFLKGIGTTIVHGPQDDNFAPGYYSILFEDPDGVRLEINHVPGRGVFDADGKVRAD